MVGGCRAQDKPYFDNVSLIDSDGGFWGGAGGALAPPPKKKKKEKGRKKKRRGEKREKILIILWMHGSRPGAHAFSEREIRPF